MSHCVTGALRAQKTYLVRRFAKSKNLKPEIYANKAYKWISGYGIFIKPILQGKMAFNATVTL
jgi:hypothetical protein